MHRTSAMIWNTIKIQFKKEPEYRINLGYWLNLDRTQLMNIYWNTNINILLDVLWNWIPFQPNINYFHFYWSLKQTFLSDIITFNLILTDWWFQYMIIYNISKILIRGFIIRYKWDTAIKEG